MIAFCKALGNSVAGFFDGFRSGSSLLPIVNSSPMPICKSPLRTNHPHIEMVQGVWLCSGNFSYSHGLVFGGGYLAATGDTPFEAWRKWNAECLKEEIAAVRSSW